MIGSVERRDGSAMLIATFDRASGVRGDLVERAGVRGLPLEAMMSPAAAPLAITDGRQVELNVPERRPVRIPAAARLVQATAVDRESRVPAR